MIVSKRSKNEMQDRITLFMHQIDLSHLKSTCGRLCRWPGVWVLFLLTAASLLSGCASLSVSPQAVKGAGSDAPLPDGVRAWTEGGVQSRVTPRIRSVAEACRGESRRERLYWAMGYVWESFAYDPWLKTRAFRRTADVLYEDKRLSGCSDFALAEIALFRAVGIPARMVITCNVDWIHLYRMDGVSLPEGHSFIEVYLEDRWHLVDSTFRWLFSEYDPEEPFYPHGEIFVRRGRDFWDMGIRSLGDLERMLKQAASRYEGGFREPVYPKDPL